MGRTATEPTALSAAAVVRPAEEQQRRTPSVLAQWTHAHIGGGAPAYLMWLTSSGLPLLVFIYGSVRPALPYASYVVMPPLVCTSVLYPPAPPPPAPPRLPHLTHYSASHPVHHFLLSSPSRTHQPICTPHTLPSSKLLRSWTTSLQYFSVLFFSYSSLCLLYIRVLFLLLSYCVRFWSIDTLFAVSFCGSHVCATYVSGR